MRIPGRKGKAGEWNGKGGQGGGLTSQDQAAMRYTRDYRDPRFPVSCMHHRRRQLEHRWILQHSFIAIGALSAKTTTPVPFGAEMELNPVTQNYIAIAHTK